MREAKDGNIFCFYFPSHNNLMCLMYPLSLSPLLAASATVLAARKEAARKIGEKEAEEIEEDFDEIRAESGDEEEEIEESFSISGTNRSRNEELREEDVVEEEQDIGMSSSRISSVLEGGETVEEMIVGVGTSSRTLSSLDECEEQIKDEIVEEEEGWEGNDPSQTLLDRSSLNADDGDEDVSTHIHHTLPLSLSLSLSSLSYI